jgi:hypothetical protein
MSLNSVSRGLASRHRRATDSGDGGAAVAGPPGAVTPGMAMVQEAVRFTNAQVLDPTSTFSGTIQPTGMDVGANTLAEQAGAMMIEDVRSFLQSMEMIIVPAAAKALAEALANKPAGAATITLLGTLMTDLAKFAGAVIGEASSTSGAIK